MKNTIVIFLLILSVIACKNDTSKATTEVSKEALETAPKTELIIHPISHATMVLEYGDTIIYIDPVGGGEPFKSMKAANLVLITDIHGDHLNIETLLALKLEQTTMVVPQAVAEKIPDELKDNLVVLSNGKASTVKNEDKNLDVKVQAIPMYNLREEALKFHDKGRGNGYVITLGGQRIYISGDTEDIPEMRALKGIDIAFVCMNLPYTMTVESAANAVLEFKPKRVYPYHYRGTEGFSDVAQFKSLVNDTDPNIKVIQLNWYP